MMLWTTSSDYWMPLVPGTDWLNQRRKTRRYEIVVWLRLPVLVLTMPTGLTGRPLMRTETSHYFISNSPLTCTINYTLATEITSDLLTFWCLSLCYPVSEWWPLIFFQRF